VNALLRAAAALVFVLLASAFSLAGPRAAEAPRPIAINAAPIVRFDPRRPEMTRFGALEFRGGLVLTSPDKEFGGLSSFRIGDDGARFVTASDKARWFRGRIVYDGTRPAAIADAETAPMLGADGTPTADRGLYDSESFAEDGGTFYVGFERANRILRFDYGKDGLRARGRDIRVPPAVRTLPNNKGLECLAVPPDAGALAGTLVAISERGLDRDGDIMGFLIGGAKAGTFGVKREAKFDVSDCAFLPDGDLLVLQRKFSWMTGMTIRIVRVAAAALAPGAVVNGPVLLEADLGYEIDNMEGLAAHRDAQGATVLTLVSDDNFSLIQRTLLLQFALTE
jgi:hypothetical protein